VARFCASDSARLFDAVCREYHLDPGAGIADDYLAHQLRVGLFTRFNRPDDRESWEANQAADLARIRRAQAEVIG